jgi:hypothetical protein
VGESGGSGSIIASANYDGSGVEEVVKGSGAFMMGSRLGTDKIVR